MDKLALAEMTCFPGNNKLVLKEVTKKNVGHSSGTKHFYNQKDFR
jgi:hypothetical protein